MNAPGVLLVRCDASVSIGTGHAMRCLALAQAWQDIGGRAVFAMARSTAAVEERLEHEGVGITRLQAETGSGDDAQATIALARAQTAAWVVVDGYDFGADFQAAVKRHGLKLLCVDDNGEAGHYSADLILNQNAHATEAVYEGKAQGVQLLLGSRFCLLRREFAAWHGWSREVPDRVKRILVTMGGSDADNFTLRVIDAIRLLEEDDLETTVVVGGSNPHVDLLESAVRDGGAAFSLLKDPSNMPELLSAADLAVAGAGTTCWEMCLLGLPALICVLADNQESIASTLASRGIVRSLGRSKDVSIAKIQAELLSLLDNPGEQQRMSERGRALVDGNGAARTASLLQDKLRIRRTVQDDCRILWEWANDPEVVAASFSSGPIPWEAHVAWFRAKLSDPWAILYTGTYVTDEPVGQVRFQQAGPRATLSIGLAKGFRGRGLGRTLLFLACERLFRESKVEAIDAYVKPDNETSIGLFSNSGFRRLGTESVRNQSAIHFVFERSVWK
jgi:UDP-2,4-diacetamido-2,4,6-trideoxy-beta-L-altropyranose hydrolase